MPPGFALWTQTLFLRLRKARAPPPLEGPAPPALGCLLGKEVVREKTG